MAEQQEDAYSKKADSLFQLTLTNVTNCYVMDGASNSLMTLPVEMYNGATGGSFLVEKLTNGTFRVRYEGITMKSFAVLFAFPHHGEWYCNFCLFTHSNCLSITKLVSPIHLRSGIRHNIPDAALALCIESTELNMDVLLRNEEYGNLKWTPTSFVVSDSLNNAIPLANLPFADVSPNHYHRCPECLVFSLDGRGHISPCAPLRSISPRRKHMYSDTMTTVFQLRFDQQCSIQIFDSEHRVFFNVDPGLKLHNDIIEGIFSFKKLQSDQTVMSYNAVSIKRFAIVFAFWYNDAWRVRFRLVITSSNGLVAFPLTKTLFIDDDEILMPSEYKTNTVLFFGLHSEAEVNKLALRIWANSSGVISTTHGFNGYETTVQWSKKTDRVTISPELKSRYARDKKFSTKLYRANGVHKMIASLSSQRKVAAPIAPNLNVPMTPNNADNEVRISFHTNFP